MSLKCLEIFLLVIVVGVSGVRRTGRSIFFPQTSVPDASVVAPYPDSQLAQFFPTPTVINVPGIQHPYFKSAQNLPQVNIDGISGTASR